MVEATACRAYWAAFRRWRARHRLTALVDKPLSRVSEAYRTIAATLGHAPDAQLGIIAIASATPRDKTSALTSNIAFAMQEFGVRCVLVDANLRSGTISSSLGLSGPGLTDCLRGDVALAQALTSVHGLAVLPAGSTTDSPAELMSGTKFDKIVKSLKSDFDMVIMDAAPALPLSDTLFAASVADSTVLAISAGRVTSAELTAAADALDGGQREGRRRGRAQRAGDGVRRRRRDVAVPPAQARRRLTAGRTPPCASSSSPRRSPAAAPSSSRAPGRNGSRARSRRARADHRREPVERHPGRPADPPLRRRRTWASCALCGASSGESRRTRCVALQNYPNLARDRGLRGRRGRPAVLVSERNITTREGEPASRGARVRQWLAQRLVPTRRPRGGDLAPGRGRARERVPRAGATARRRAQPGRPRGGAACADDDGCRPFARRRDVRRRPSRCTSCSRCASCRRSAPRWRWRRRQCCARRGRTPACCASPGATGVVTLQSEAESAGVPFAVGGWSGDWAAATPPDAVAVLPSYREGFGNVLVEAALAGIPSVAVSNAYGVADALVPTITGELAPFGTPDALAGAIRRASGMPLTHVGELGAAVLHRRERPPARRIDPQGDRTARDRVMRVLVSAVGQHDNVGDTVLRRGLLDALRTIAPLQVYVGDKSEGYLDGLGLQADDIAVRDGAEWRRPVSRQLLAGRAVYAFDTGETELQAAFARRYAADRAAPARQPAAWRRRRAARRGRARGDPVAASHLGRAAPLRHGHLARRDEPADHGPRLGRAGLGLRARCARRRAARRRTPAAAARDRVPPEPQSRRARQARRRVGRHGAIRSPDELGLQPVVVAQIARDNPLAEELAERLGCAAVPWLDDNHARQEERLRATYRDSAIVLSDRLHAVVIGATEGAVPIALSTGPMDKIIAHARGRRHPRHERGRATCAIRDAALSVIRDGLARRAEIMSAVADARRRLDDGTPIAPAPAAAKGLISAATEADALAVAEGTDDERSDGLGHHPRVPGGDVSARGRGAAGAAGPGRGLRGDHRRGRLGRRDGRCRRASSRRGIRSCARSCSRRTSASRGRGSGASRRRPASTCGSSTPTTPGPTPPCGRLLDVARRERADVAVASAEFVYQSGARRALPAPGCPIRSRAARPSACCCAARSPGTSGTSSSAARSWRRHPSLPPAFSPTSS